MKLLYRIIENTTQNRMVRNYLETSLIAKIVKDQINVVLCEACSSSSRSSIKVETVLEEELRAYVEGKSAKNNQYWKKIAVNFRKKWGFSINTHEIIGPYFLSCLMTLIPARYDITKLNKNKKIFEETNIIGENFVTKILPKTKSYHRYQDHPRDRIVQISKHSGKNYKIFEDISQQFNLDQKKVPEYYSLNNGLIYIMGYLSDYVPAANLTEQQTYPCSAQIYNANLSKLSLDQPPSAPILKIITNYLEQCLESSNYAEFEKVLKPALENALYWLGETHPYIC